MRASLVTALGPPEVLEVGQVPEPVPGPGEVAIEVAFAGLNFADTKIRKGEHYATAQTPFILGREVSGRVRSIGEGVEGLAVGDLVAARVPGSGYAEVVVTRADLTIALGSDASPDVLATAAIAPTAIGTCLMILEYATRFRSGASLLVHGAAGGVGLTIAQVARRMGASQILGSVGDERKIPIALAAGYTDVFLRDGFATGVAAATAGRGVDVVVDPVGGSVRADSIASLAPLGLLVAIGEASGDAGSALTGAELRKRNVGMIGVSLEGVIVSDRVRGREILAKAVELAVSGEVVFPETTVFDLERADEAHALLEGGTSIGKVLLRVAHGEWAERR